MRVCAKTSTDANRLKQREREKKTTSANYIWECRCYCCRRRRWKHIVTSSVNVKNGSGVDDAFVNSLIFFSALLHFLPLLLLLFSILFSFALSSLASVHCHCRPFLSPGTTLFLFFAFECNMRHTAMPLCSFAFVLFSFFGVAFVHSVVLSTFFPLHPAIHQGN